MSTVVVGWIDLKKLKFTCQFQGETSRPGSDENRSVTPGSAVDWRTPVMAWRKFVDRLLWFQGDCPSTATDVDAATSAWPVGGLAKKLVLSLLVSSKENRVNRAVPLTANDGYRCLSLGRLNTFVGFQGESRARQLTTLTDQCKGIG